MSDVRVTVISPAGDGASAEQTVAAGTKAWELFKDEPVRDTIEIRILPGSIDADEILNRAAVMELLLERCLDPAPFPPAPEDVADAVSALTELAAGVLADLTP